MREALLEEIAVKRAERDVVNEEIERLRGRAKALSTEISSMESRLPRPAPSGKESRVLVNR